jgi:hypothetical protein
VARAGGFSILIVGDSSNVTARDDAEAEAMTDAVDVLRVARAWELAPARWALVEAIVEAIAAALTRGDLEALRNATADLELAAPVRITRIGTTPTVPAPELVRERTNHLVHSLELAVRRYVADRLTRDGGSGDRPPAR